MHSERNTQKKSFPQGGAIIIEKPNTDIITYSRSHCCIKTMRLTYFIGPHTVKKTPTIRCTVYVILFLSLLLWRP